MANDRYTITDIAARIGVTTKTIVRWEKSGKVASAKRDWRGWRTYDKSDLKRLKDFKETIIYTEEDHNGKE
jgi:DNA-binding transcriptional MerR regulator